MAPDCNSCEKKRAVDPVPYVVHESAMARNERTVKRIVIALLVVIILWFATVCTFVWYLNQYDFESYEYTQDGEGVNIIGDGNGVGYNGADVPETNQD